MSRLFSGTPFARPERCPTCGKMPTECRCMQLPQKKKMSGDLDARRGAAGNRLDSGLVLTPENSVAPADQVAKIRVEKRKGGRLVTVISGMEHPANDLSRICTELKQALSVGGSVQGRTVELQGDHAEFVQRWLTERKLRSRIV